MSPDLENDFRKALLEDDEIGIVIRSHLYIENLLDELLSLLPPFPEEYEEISLSYANKVRLVCAAGFDKNFKPMLLALALSEINFLMISILKLTANLLKTYIARCTQSPGKGLQKCLAKWPAKKNLNISSSTTLEINLLL